MSSPMSEGDPVPVRGVTAHARSGPDRPAVVLGDVVRTYGELDDRAARLATVLSGLGVGPGRPVAAVLPNGIEIFEVATAASMLDAPFLPVNRHLRAAELAVGAADPLPGADAGGGPELMFYTSGTTARPKGVVHAGIASGEGRRRVMEGQVALWGWTADDVYVMSGPAYHASHLGWSLCALYVGAATVVTEQFEARAWLGEVERHRGTRSFMVPAHFIRILELPEEDREALDTSSLSLIVHAAAPCPVAVKYRMMDAFPDTEIHELYGASEGGATKISPEEWRARPGSVGRPWPGVEIRILDEEGAPVPTGEPGIVYIRPAGPQRFSYRNDEAATERAWHDDAFTVGDIGFLDADGYLTITDRVSDMVLWGGVNIAPREIEEVLFDHPAVVDCAVFGIPDERDGERLKAMVQLRAEVTTDELAEFVAGRLAKYKVPRVWEVVDELPRDHNGKVRKRLLAQAHRPGD